MASTAMSYYWRRVVALVFVFAVVTVAAVLFAPGLRIEPSTMEGTAVTPTVTAVPPTTTTTVALSNDGYLPAVTLGDCASYGQHFVDHGLPRDEFLHVAWVESGCNHMLRITDDDDHGGGLLGFNLRPDLAGYWLEACGLTYENLTDSLDRQIACAAKAYADYGSEPWENSWP